MRKRKRKKRTYIERSGFNTKHHIKNKCNGGGSVKNLILLDEMRHSAFHLLFKNMDFFQAAQLLIRAYRMKTGIEVELWTE